MKIPEKKKPVVKECKECGKQFQTIRKDKIYCSRECAKAYNQRDWAQRRYGVRPEESICEYCGDIFTPKKIGTKFCSASCRTGQWRVDNSDRNKEIRINARRNDPNDYWARKRKYVDHLGGKCEHCDEERLVCLTFHHVNPSEKITEVTSMFNNRTIKATEEDILAEVEKCILLCSNCHKVEEANPLWKEF